VSWDSDALRRPATAYAQTLCAISLMKIRLLTIGLLIVFLACESKRTALENKSESSERQDTTKKSVPVDTIRKGDCHDWLSDSDSTLSTGDYVKYIKKNGRIKIEWGNKKFKKTLNRDFDCNGASSWVPYIRWTTPEYIGLHYGCGSPCWGAIILPLNPTDSSFERMYEFDVDTKNNQIVYLDNSEYKKLVVANWKTGKKTEIKIKVRCDSAFPGYCIDSLKLQNGELYVRWKEVIGDKFGKETSETIRVGL
jgi:hypothetical protein